MGKVLKNRYELLTELGHGGMSTVYLARDLNLGSYWAVKHMKNNASTELLEFKKESELLAGLNHPDIPRIVDRIEDFEDYYVVMDFVDGVSLGKLIVSEGPISEEKLISWSKMLCSILQYLHTVHADPIVYRDMKPDNIILSQSGRVKLIDFGIAKECKRGVRDDGECYGTRGYAAPEQYKSGSNILDERTDIYSLGCTMFYLVTGKVPGKAPNACPPVRTINPNLSEGIQYIISKATADDPKDRYQNTDEMLGDLEHITELSSEYREKMRKRVLAFVVCLILTIVFAGVSVWGYVRIQQNNRDMYMEFFNEGVKWDGEREYQLAAESFTSAIQYDPDDQRTYPRLFSVLLKNDKIADPKERRINAIDIISKYIDSGMSGASENNKLKFDVAMECCLLTEPEYANKAIEYFQSIKDSKESDLYPNIDYYYVLAKRNSNNKDDVTVTELTEAIDCLEKYTIESDDLSAYERLTNYSLLISMIQTEKLGSKGQNSYDRIQELGLKAKDKISTSDEDDLGAFDPYEFYLSLGSANFDGSKQASEDDVEKYLLQAIEWFELANSSNVKGINQNGKTVDYAKCYDKLYKIYYDQYNLDRDNNLEAGEKALSYLKEELYINEKLTEKKPEESNTVFTVEQYDDCRTRLAKSYVNYADLTGDANDVTRAREYLELLENDNEFTKQKDLDKVRALMEHSEVFGFHA